ncbi:SpoIIIAH-like family protein [Neobacillus sp. MM2021_6]|uniref:SpoIIIAH-like family protein n=1 Tax=Bacillaceae TaxID=186817 RepID=UPI00140BB677|nr:MULTISPECIES: SpoIIIAH-like family protein [Bacillaceae]MBO0960798.1 SpoIIIAH-like family protein [Neobacillus sp. MM2021_6]NHC17078.1 SpoIIIAH-like family protein [Bacillus sp. MM2020_4]WML40501.1 SpoIIIAH-like family protein [Neobacillus sp. OS1-2]
MLLKKQTVWLLTMLSLVVVLSVYYITSPEQKTNDLAAVQQNAKDQNQGKTKTEVKKDGKTVVSTVAGDNEFAELRMKLEDLRSEEQTSLTEELASTDLSADERSKVKDQMDKLNKIAQSEEMLETFIKTMGFDDVLVRADGSKVIVTVKSKKKPSASEANKIMLEVKKEIDETNYVAVEYQHAK